MMLLCLALAFASCSDDFAQPPVILPDGGLGTGQWDDPYRTSQLANGGKGNGIWITGYIVGWIDTSGDSFAMDANTCTFNADNVTINSNILMAVSPDETNYENCVPVALTGDIRDALNLQSHPENLGKQVTVKGNNERYFSNNGGIKSLTAYNWGPIGIKERPAIYSSEFSTGDACGFTFQQGELPSGLSYVWKVDTRYGLVASGYYNGGRYDTDAWAVSPEIDLTGYTSADVSWRWAGNYFTTTQNILDMTGAYIREVGGEWTKLEGLTYPEGTSFTYVDCGGVDLTPYVGKKIQIGFRYTSTSTIAGTWEIDSFNVYGDNE